MTQSLKFHPAVIACTGGIRHRFAAEALEARIAPAANMWIGVASGNWTDPLNWSDGVPTADDDVTINPAGVLTITIPSGAQVASSLSMPGDEILQIAGGSLTLTSASSVSNLTFSGGTLNAGPRLALAGTGTFSGEATISGFLRIDGTFSITGTPNLTGTIENAGIITNSGRLDFSGSGRLDNLLGGVFEVNQAGTGDFASGGAAPGFFNAGTFRLNLGGTASTSADFNNLPGGTIELDAGSLNFSSSIWQGANLQIGTGAQIAFTGGEILLSGTFAGTGGGVFRFAGGTQGASEGAMLIIGGGGVVVNLPNGAFELAGNATIAGGTLLNQGVMRIFDRPDLKATIENAGTIRHFGRLDMN
jgi:fibronectin-binding autotransporter adhesin